MNPLELVKLPALMEHTSGRPEIVVGVIDGPVALNHPDLADGHRREVPEMGSAACAQTDNMACLHGTFVAGILFARRGSNAPAICPGCTLLAYPIFSETAGSGSELPSAKPQELARAILACIAAGARILNVSAAIAQTASRDERELEEALDHAARRGVIVAAAAGNQGTLGSSAVTRHPWVIPVIGCDLQGRPTAESNLGSSIGRRGLGAPGDRVTSLGAEGEPVTLGGTSAAVPFVTGAIALLWSEFPDTTTAEVKMSVTRTSARRNTVVPPVLDAWAAYRTLATTHS